MSIDWSNPQIQTLITIVGGIVLAWLATKFPALKPFIEKLKMLLPVAEAKAAQLRNEGYREGVAAAQTNMLSAYASSEIVAPPRESAVYDLNNVIAYFYDNRNVEGVEACLAVAKELHKVTPVKPDELLVPVN